MKIRKGFVTNSSSSSFITIYIESPLMADIIGKYNSMFEGDYCTNVSCEAGIVDIHIEEGWGEIPHRLDNLLVALVNCLGLEVYDENDLSDCDESELKHLAIELFAQKEEILKDIETVEFTCGETGWQGDSDARYCKENYDEETLQDIMETIAEYKGCTVDEVTDADFYDYVGDMVSTSEYTFSYDKDTGESSVSHDFYVE